MFPMVESIQQWRKQKIWINCRAQVEKNVFKNQMQQWNTEFDWSSKVPIWKKSDDLTTATNETLQKMAERENFKS